MVVVDVFHRAFAMTSFQTPRIVNVDDFETLNRRNHNFQMTDELEQF